MKIPSNIRWNLKRRYQSAQLEQQQKESLHRAFCEMFLCLLESLSTRERNLHHRSSPEPSSVDGLLMVDGWMMDVGGKKLFRRPSF